jgi:hypothetical protein
VRAGGAGVQYTAERRGGVGGAEGGREGGGGMERPQEGKAFVCVPGVGRQVGAVGGWRR